MEKVKVSAEQGKQLDNVMTLLDEQGRTDVFRDRHALYTYFTRYGFGASNRQCLNDLTSREFFIAITAGYEAKVTIDDVLNEFKREIGEESYGRTVMSRSEYMYNKGISDAIGILRDKVVEFTLKQEGTQ